MVANGPHQLDAFGQGAEVENDDVGQLLRDLRQRDRAGRGQAHDLEPFIAADDLQEKTPRECSVIDNEHPRAGTVERMYDTSQSGSALPDLEPALRRAARAAANCREDRTM